MTCIFIPQIEKYNRKNIVSIKSHNYSLREILHEDLQKFRLRYFELSLANNTLQIKRRHENDRIAPVVLSPSFFCAAQDSATMHYPNRHFDQLVDLEKAKFSETIIRDKGTVTTTRRDLKKNIVIYRHAEKGDEPVGICITATVNISIG